MLVREECHILCHQLTIFLFILDVLLKCLSSNWELHRPYVQKSGTLAALIKDAKDPTPQVYYKSPASETLDKYIEDSEYYSNEYQEISKRLSVLDEGDRQKKEKKGLDHPAHVSETRVNDVTVIELEVHDASISKRGKLSLILKYSYRYFQ